MGGIQDEAAGALFAALALAALNVWVRGHIFGQGS